MTETLLRIWGWGFGLWIVGLWLARIAIDRWIWDRDYFNAVIWPYCLVRYFIRVQREAKAAKAANKKQDDRPLYGEDHED